jgi:hypothetical protein
MRALFPTLVRLIVVTGIALTAVAVTLGRHQRIPQDHRRMVTPRYQPISDHLFPGREPGIRLLDTRNGQLRTVGLESTDRIEYAACSPWQDGQGRTQLIGLWKEVDGSIIRSMGLGRYALPGGEVLDRVVMEVIPGSPFCWYPGTSLRILFAGWDGRLYHFSFEPLAGDGAGSFPSDPHQPQPLSWKATPINRGRILMADPTWPSDPRLGGRVIVSVTLVEESEPDHRRTRTQLWWLSLSGDGLVVEEAGRLIAPGPPDPHQPVLEERLASVASTPDGDLVLAYMVRRSGDLMLQLRLVPLGIDSVTGAPQADELDAVDLAGGRASSPPVFSEDGRWVYTIPRVSSVPLQALRSSVVSALGSRPGTRAHLREGRGDPLPGSPPAAAPRPGVSPLVSRPTRPPAAPRVARPRARRS